jgi:integrase
MATVFRKTVTRPLPASAKLIQKNGEPYAVWTSGNRKQEARVVTQQDGSTRVVAKTKTYYAKFRDGNNILVERPTGCTTEAAAKQVLNDWLSRAERVKSGLISAQEDRVIDELDRPIQNHIDDFIAHMEVRKRCLARRKSLRSRLMKISRLLGWTSLKQVDEQPLERWLTLRQQQEGLSASVWNAYREAWVSFCNWGVRTSRMVSNPFKSLPKCNERSDPRRPRRALTEQELVRLLEVTQLRPLADLGRPTQKKKRDAALSLKSRRTWTKDPVTPENLHECLARTQRANLKPDRIQALQELGRERALIYKTFVITGLRRGELASLTVNQIDLKSNPPRFILKAADEKNRKGSTLAIREDLAMEIDRWLTDKLERLQQEARANNQPIPSTLPLTTKIFRVPTALVKIMNLDLAAAGVAKCVIDTNGKRKIDKLDASGRSVDVHALRHSFATLLTVGGVAPRVAQAALRHSSLDLTMNTYTDPVLLDVAGSLNRLPAFPLTQPVAATPQQSPVITSETAPVPPAPVAPSVAPFVAPTTAQTCPLESSLVLSDTNENRRSIIAGSMERPDFQGVWANLGPLDENFGKWS